MYLELYFWMLLCILNYLSFFDVIYEVFFLYFQVVCFCQVVYIKDFGVQGIKYGKILILRRGVKGGLIKDGDFDFGCLKENLIFLFYSWIKERVGG